MKLPSEPLDQPKRLAIMILLERYHCLVFSELYKTLKLSRGSVDSHLRRLEESGLVTRSVEFINTSSRSLVCITQEGLSALNQAKEVWRDLLETG